MRYAFLCTAGDRFKVRGKQTIQNVYCFHVNSYQVILIMEIKQRISKKEAEKFKKKKK